MRVLAVVHEPDAGPGVFGEFPVWAPGAEPPPPIPDALLVFGGSMHVDQSDVHRWLDGEKAFLREALGRGVPILGVCLGGQLLAEAAGARPHRMPEPEIGWIDGKPAWGLQFHAEVTRESLWGWLDGWDNSEAAHTTLDPDQIRAASEQRIENQNEIGRGIAERFLAEAARHKH